MSAPESGTDRAARLRRAIAAKRAGAGPRAATLDSRPPGETAWLGELQRGLWFVHQLAPDSPAYNLASAFRIQGPLDVATLERAVQTVVDRHRLLRSTFRAQDGEPMQVIHEHLPVTVQRIAAGPGQGEARAAREASRPFDLARGPLIRVALVEESPGGDRLLILVLHHLLADERSLEFLWRQIADLYAGESDQTSGVVPQYDDYIYWLRQAAPDRRDDLDYWRRQLDPLPDVLQLPFERTATEPARAGAPGRLLQRTLDPALGTSLRRLASSLGVTPFVIGAFAFRLLLDRYTGGQRIAFATPVSARAHPSAAEMIGYFLNALPICTPVDEGLPVGESIVRFNATVTEGLAHSATPFDLLAAELSPRRDLGRHPIFQAMFVYQESGPPPALGEARLEPVTLDLGASKFDLTVFALEQPAAWRIGVEYRTDRFDAVWMERLLGHYERLLDELPRQADRALADVTMLSETEAVGLSSWERGPALDVELPPSIPSQVLEHAAARPDAPAVICDDRTQRYADLASSARAIGAALVAGGVAPGGRVAVFCDRGLPMVAALLGSHLAGAGYVPLDPAYPPTRTLDVLRDAEVSAVITTAALRDRLPEGSWPTILADVVSANGTTSALPDLSPALPAYVLYTSGSTGRPKGVVVSHDNLRRSTLARLQVYASPPDRFLLLPSIAFDSSVAGIFWTLATGGTLVVPTDDEARDARHLTDLIERQSVTTLLCVPSLYAQLLRAGASKLATLRTVIVAGESCPSALVHEHFAALPGARLFNEYGPTEATVWASVHEMSPDDAARPVPIGRPIPGVRVEVRDRRGRQTPAGVPGDGWIVGPTVAAGYWQRDDLTAERFSGSGDERRYRTGDRLAWTDDGTLLFLGRDDEQLKLRGYRIEPGEIEGALREFVKVEEAAVVLRGAGRAGPPAADDPAAQLVAFVTTAAASVMDGWRRALSDRLPAHLIPARVVRLDSLPRLPNGKVDRRALQQIPLDAPPAESTRALTPRELALSSLWERLLGRSGIGAGENFFELGGHSLLVMQLVAAIEREFDVVIAAADVFQHPTVRELARRIDERGEHLRGYEQLFPIQTDGRRSPFIMVVPDFFTEALAKRFRGERPVYGVRGVSLRTDGNRGRWPTMRHLAEEIAGEIERRFPGRACVLAGYSFGAWVAIEVARVLEQRHVPMQHLYAIAPMPVDFYRVGPFRIRVDGLRQPLADLGIVDVIRHYARASNPFTRGPYRRARQWLFERPWRRLLARLGARRLRRGLPMTTRQAQADVRVERFRLHASYCPGVVRAPTTLFNPAGLATDSAATWRPFFRGPLTVHAIPDPHDEASVTAARERIFDHLRDLGD